MRRHEPIDHIGMKPAKPSKPSSFRRFSICYYVATSLAAFGVIGLLLSSPIRLPLKPSAVRCIKFDSYGQTREGIGAVLRRNQLGIFIAQTYSAKISLPEMVSEHGYKMHEMFDSCPNPSEQCMLDESQMVLYRCPRGDCKCHREQLYRYTEDMAGRCNVIGYRNQKVRTMEYSGCTGETLARYFGTSRKPKIPYDALHYRSGDLAGARGGKSFGPFEFYYLLKTMCFMSDRDIVIVTEGLPSMPQPANCEGRLVLASDTSIADVFRIIQHATTVSIGTSSLATMMMDVAKPTRMVVLERTVPMYAWVNCEFWTVIGPHGAVFHFNNKKLMLEAVNSGTILKFRSLRTDNQHSGTKFQLAVPTRRWTNDTNMSWARKPNQ